MTPQQQTALEALVGRALTEPEIEQIGPMVADGRYPSIAEVLSIDYRTVQPRMVSSRGLASGLPGGTMQAEAILLKLEGARDQCLQSEDPQQKLLGSALRRQMKWLDAEGLDFGAPELRTMLDSFAPDILTAEEVAALKSLALMPATLSEHAVRAALEA